MQTFDNLFDAICNGKGDLFMKSFSEKYFPDVE